MIKNIKNKNIRELLSEGETILKKSGNQRAAEETVLLLSYLLNREKYDLYLNLSLPVNDQKIQKYSQWIEKRAKGVPVQYITGFQNFMGLEFKVKEGVLIPRPETEVLVERIVALIESKKEKHDMHLLDIGVGSGIIPITICHYFRNSNKNIYFYAIDISKKAIELAKENSKKFNCSENIAFYQGDMFMPLQGLIQSSFFDGIVSNPPYISKNEFCTLASEIYFYEPFEALYGGEKGLDFYQKMIQESGKYLKEDGFLALEIGYNQKDAVCQMIHDHRDYQREIDIYRDYFHNERVVIAFTKTGSKGKEV